MKVLVVDDDESILDALSLILKECGYTVETACNKKFIYQKVSVFKPDLILLDVCMSGNDGRQVCFHLKHHIATKNIPIIMISAYPGVEAGALECGAEEFLPKPFETVDLLERIKRYSDKYVDKKHALV